MSPRIRLLPESHRWPVGHTPNTDAEGVSLVLRRPSDASMRAWDLFLERTDDAVRRLGFRGNEEVWFRGTTDAKTGLLPSLFRQELTARQTTAVEVDAFFEFQARAAEAQQGSISGWDMLFMMQHYQIPTRLLDWTDALGTAIFMAMDSPNLHVHEFALIHVLNPYAMNELLEKHPKDAEREVFTPRAVLDWYGVDDYEELLLLGGRWKFRAYAIYPSQKSARHRAQRGQFTFHGDSRAGLNYLPRNERFLQTVRLPVEAYEAAKYYFWLYGIDRFAVYPELDSLGRSIAEKYALGREHAKARAMQRRLSR